ncbi:hypothetical protein [Curtobacterium flaccumfaciens]|uniref:hypothetical protein n=1 Tax=Curtobacterium flaccumfaciens TaxID=2035 RepID=UPI003D9A68C2
MREEVVVVVGGWEHDCCGPAYERQATAAFTAYGRTPRFAESRHHDDPFGITEFRGRVADLFVVAEDGTRIPVHRIPSGRALGGSDPDDDGHLEVPWTAERIEVESDTFEIVVDVHVPGSGSGSAKRQ